MCLDEVEKRLTKLVVVVVVVVVLGTLQRRSGGKVVRIAGCNKNMACDSIQSL
jgi:hypothetical protein